MRETPESDNPSLPDGQSPSSNTAAKKGKNQKKLGKRGPKRSKQQRLLDQAKVIGFLQKGWSFNKISGVMKLDVAQVYEDYKRALARIEKRVALGNPGQYKAKAILELEGLKEEVREAWERSKQPAVEQTVEEVPVETCASCQGSGMVEGNGQKRCLRCNGSGRLGGIIRKETRRKGRLPDVRYIKSYQESLEMELALKGVEIGGEDKDSSGIGGGSSQQQLPWIEVLKKAIDEVDTPDPIEAEILAITNEAEKPAELPCGLVELPKSEVQNGGDGT